MQILPTKLIPVAACVPHDRNYNKHSNAQIEDLRESLRQFGQVRPIAVRPLSAKQYQIVAGEGLWTAAKAEGWKQLNAVIIPKSWSEAKVLAYLAADNELARRGSPDQAQLDAIVREVLDAEGDVLARLAAGEQKQLERIMSYGRNGMIQTMDGGYFKNGDHAENYLKFYYRIEAANRARNGVGLELYAGQGQLSQWYQRRFKKLVRVDREGYDGIEFVMSAEQFIEKHLREFKGLDFVDFDDEGSPALVIQKFFKAYKPQRDFVMAFTDGIVNSWKVHGKWTPAHYLAGSGGAVKSTSREFDHCTEIIRDFIECVAKPSRIEWLALERNSFGSAVYGTCLVKPR